MKETSPGFWEQKKPCSLSLRINGSCVLEHLWYFHLDLEASAQRCLSQYRLLFLLRPNHNLQLHYDLPCLEDKSLFLVSIFIFLENNLSVKWILKLTLFSVAQNPLRNRWIRCRILKYVTNNWLHLWLLSTIFKTEWLALATGKSLMARLAGKRKGYILT